jgi:hypothetical protein
MLKAHERAGRTAGGAARSDATERPGQTENTEVEGYKDADAVSGKSVGFARRYGAAARQGRDSKLENLIGMTPLEI